MNALATLLLFFVICVSPFATAAIMWAIKSYYQSAYYYIKINRGRGRVRR